MPHRARNLSHTHDDAVVREANPAGDVPVPGPLDLPDGDHGATLRAAEEHLTEMAAWLSYYADAAERTGHSRAAEVHRRQWEDAARIAAQLRPLWLGDEFSNPTVIDELRISLERLNRRMEQLLTRRDGGPPRSGPPAWDAYAVTACKNGCRWPWEAAAADPDIECTHWAPTRWWGEPWAEFLASMRGYPPETVGICLTLYDPRQPLTDEQEQQHAQRLRMLLTRA